jgi:hypothetical protein
MSKLVRVEDDTYDLLNQQRKRKETFDQVIWDMCQDYPEDEYEDE